MRSALIAASALALSACVAFAADDSVMANFYGNTVVSKGKHPEARTLYMPDHKFVMKIPAFGVDFTGTWTVDTNGLCRTFDSPPPGVTNPLCVPAVARKVGDTWTLEDSSVSLVQGEQ